MRIVTPKTSMKTVPLWTINFKTRSGQIGLLTSCLLLVLWAFLAFWAIQSREQTLTNRKEALGQTVSVVEEQTAQMLSLIRLTLRSVDQWITDHPDQSPNETASFVEWVNDLRAASGQRIDIRMVNRDAKLVYIPSRSDAAATDVSDREYFQVQNQPATRGFHIARSVHSRVTNKWGIPVSIPVTNTASHIKVVYGAIELDNLNRLQRPLLASQEESIYLLRRDGVVLSRTPLLPEMLGLSVADIPAWATNASQRKGVFITDDQPFAGVKRIVAFSQMQEYPLIIVVTAPLETVLMPWRKEVALLLLLGLLFSIGFLLMAVKLARAVRANELAYIEIEKQAEDLQIANKSLNVLSITDKLTQLYNRLKLDEALVNETNRARRYKHDFSVVILDIDHFKTINDTYGHQSGDAALIQVAEILKQCARETDIVGRWGGEEFLIILPETPAAKAYAFAEKLRHLISSCALPTVGHLTASIGVAHFNPESDTPANLLERADKALYEAKHSGRNKVVFLAGNENTTGTV